MAVYGLDTGEMTTAIERFRNWAAEVAGIDLPDAEDQAWLDFISREMQLKKCGYRIWQRK